MRVTNHSISLWTSLLIVFGKTIHGSCSHVSSLCGPSPQPQVILDHRQPHYDGIGHDVRVATSYRPCARDLPLMVRWHTGSHRLAAALDLFHFSPTSI